MSAATVQLAQSTSVPEYITLDIDPSTSFVNSTAGIKTHIFQFLGARDLRAIKATSREHRHLCSDTRDTRLWKLLWKRIGIAEDKVSIPWNNIASHLDAASLSNASCVSHKYNRRLYHVILDRQFQRGGYEQKIYIEGSHEQLCMGSDRRSPVLRMIDISRKRGFKAHAIFVPLLLGVQVAATFGLGLELGIKLRDNPLENVVVLVGAGVLFSTCGLIFALPTIIPLHAGCRNRWGRQYFECEDGLRVMMIILGVCKFILFQLMKTENIGYTAPLMLTSGVTLVGQGVVSSKKAARGCRRVCDARVSFCAMITAQFKKAFQRCKREER